MKEYFTMPFEKALCWFFPRRCAICGRVVALDEDLCEECRNLKRIEPPRCLQCGRAKADCICKGAKKEYDGITAPFYYKDILVTAVHNFKFHEQPLLARKMGEEMALSVKETFSDITFDVITCVPLSKRRKNDRGYNQAELLARSVSKNLGIPYSELLRKVVNNKVQHKENARVRKINVYGVYDLIDGVDVNGKTVLLVDDVKTTGSTLNECAKMLKMHGAKKVIVTTFAIVCRK